MCKKALYHLSVFQTLVTVADYGRQSGCNIRLLSTQHLVCLKLILNDLTYRWPGRHSAWDTRPLSEKVGWATGGTYQGADPPCCTIRACTRMRRVCDSCVARDELHASARVPLLLCGCWVATPLRLPPRGLYPACDPRLASLTAQLCPSRCHRGIWWVGERVVPGSFAGDAMVRRCRE
eukprot:2769639-Pleurochrysis_carterae.AAC.1